MGLSSSVPLVLVLCYDPYAWSGRGNLAGGIGTDHRDWCLRQPRYEFLNVSNPEDLSEGRPERSVVPEVEIEAARRVSAGCETTSVRNPYE